MGSREGGDPPLKRPLFFLLFPPQRKRRKKRIRKTAKPNAKRRAKREKKENRASANSQSQKSPQGRFQFFLSLCAFFNNLESMFSSSFLLFFFRGLQPLNLSQRIQVCPFVELKKTQENAGVFSLSLFSLQKSNPSTTRTHTHTAAPTPHKQRNKRNPGAHPTGKKKIGKFL